MRLPRVNTIVKEIKQKKTFKVEGFSDKAEVQQELNDWFLLT